MMIMKYLVARRGEPEREVTFAEWRQAERAAGFSAPEGRAATAGFTGIDGTSGRVEYVPEPEAAPPSEGGIPLPGTPPEPARDPACQRCNYDTHRCPGCGEPLPHGTEVCTACRHDFPTGQKIPDDAALREREPFDAHHEHQSRHDPLVRREPGCSWCANWRHPSAPLIPPPAELFTLTPGAMITISWSGEPRTVICDRIEDGGAVIRDLTEAEAAELAEQETRHLEENRP